MVYEVFRIQTGLTPVDLINQSRSGDNNINGIINFNHYDLHKMAKIPKSDQSRNTSRNYKSEK
jgi:hypothetical protein